MDVVVSKTRREGGRERESGGRGIEGERGMERVGGRRGTNREGKKEGVAGVTLKILKDYQKKRWKGNYLPTKSISLPRPAYDG